MCSEGLVCSPAAPSPGPATKPLSPLFEDSLPDKKPTQTHTNTRAEVNHRAETKTELKVVGGWGIQTGFLTIDHKCEREILVESMFLDSYQDSVLPSILLCYIPDHQGIPIHVVSGALLCCHHAILQPVRKKGPLSKLLERRVQIIFLLQPRLCSKLDHSDDVI